MTPKKKDYQKPELVVVQMRTQPCLQDGSPNAEEDGYYSRRSFDMDED